MKKKLIATLCCVTLVAGMLAGCGKKDDAANETTPTPVDETTGETEPTDTAEGTDEEANAAEEVNPEDVTGTLTYWTYTDNAYQLTSIFAEKYPNVTIDVQVFGGDEYKTKILTALQSGTDIPDMFDLEENYAYEFLDSDLIADLSYIGVEDLTANYYDYQIASMKDGNGKYKCLTFESNPVCLWYLRDACEQWLGTSDPTEISSMITSWDDMLALQEKVYNESNGTVSVFGNIGEMVKIDAFSFAPLVQDGTLVIDDAWLGLVDNMRNFYNSGFDPELGSWGSDWAAAWNNGTLLFRAMPSWDFFTDWEMNAGNVGIAVPFNSSFEGMTGICVYNESPNKELAGTFVKYLTTDEFQIANMNNNNQVPASKTAVATMAETFSAENFAGQNLIAAYGEILENVEAVTPDKYTGAVRNLFQKSAVEGIQAGSDNETIIAGFKSRVADQYPEIVIE